MRCLLAVCLVPVLGCAALLVEPDDSLGMKAAKVGVRAVLFVGTLTASELSMERVKREQETAEVVRQIREDLARARIGMARAETPEERAYWRGVYEDALWRRQVLTGVLTAPRPVVVPEVGGGGVSCTSRRIGQTVFTDCR